MKFRKGNKIQYGQDRNYSLVGIPHGIDFKIKRALNGKAFTLTGYGYGQILEPYDDKSYGSGKLWVFRQFLTCHQWNNLKKRYAKDRKK